MAAENVQTFTDTNFETSVLNAGGPVLVDFWAEWCGPCKRLGPTIDALAGDYAGKVTIGKLNVDDNPNTAIKFQIRGIPGRAALQGRSGGRDGRRPRAEGRLQADPRQARLTIRDCADLRAGLTESLIHPFNLIVLQPTPMLFPPWTLETSSSSDRVRRG